MYFDRVQNTSKKQLLYEPGVCRQSRGSPWVNLTEGTLLKNHSVFLLPNRKQYSLIV